MQKNKRGKSMEIEVLEREGVENIEGCSFYLEEGKPN